MTHPIAAPAQQATRYLRLFVEESRERLTEMASVLATDGAREHTLWTCRRAAHQIAGSSAMIGCVGIAAFARAVERFVRRLETHGLPFGGPQRALLLRVAAALQAAVERATDGDVAAVPTPALRLLLEVWARVPRADTEASCPSTS
jgi:chemotaxis protein histidine kinase CheA